MTKIVDPDKLSQSNAASTGTTTGNVFFDTTNLTIELLPNVVGGWQDAGNELLDDNYNAGGVSLQALYSFLKEEWKSDTTLIKYPFPMIAITAEQFEFVDGWTLTDGTESPALFNSTKLIRDAGWAERDSAGAVQKEFAGIISLGTLADSAAAPYYAFDGDTAKRTLNYGGQVNEAIKIFDRTVSPDFDKRESSLTLYVRSAPTGTSPNVTGYTYAQTTTGDIGVTVLATQAYRFPLAQVVDPNITLGTSELTGGVFNDMRIEYYSTAQAITATGESPGFDVGVIIDADFGANSALVPTLNQIYNWVQNELRKSTNINVSPGDESTIGELTDLLVQFVGATLKTLRQSDNDGVFIDGVGSTELNNVEFVDNSGAAKTFPFKVGVNLDFNSNILDDPNAKYFLFYTTNTGGDFGTGNAIEVTDDLGSAVNGDVHATAAVGGDYTGPVSGTNDGDIDASAGTLTVTGAGWDATGNGELAGKILEVDATNAGKYYITSNTATVITIDAQGKGFDVDDATATWSIIEPNTANTNPRITFTYNYASNTDGGRTADTDADITLVALGLDTAQYATATGTITEVNEVTLPISNPLERNYEDPIGV